MLFSQSLPYPIFKVNMSSVVIILCCTVAGVLSLPTQPDGPRPTSEYHLLMNRAFCFKVCTCELWERRVAECSRTKITQLYLDYPPQKVRPNIVRLNLYANKIVTLPPQEYFLKWLPNLKVVTMDNNPDFDCSKFDETKYPNLTITHGCFAEGVWKSVSGAVTGFWDWVKQTGVDTYELFTREDIPAFDED